jgi:hypothetical protein
MTKKYEISKIVVPDEVFARVYAMYELSMLKTTNRTNVSSMLANRRFWQTVREEYGKELYFSKIYEAVRYKYRCSMKKDGAEAVKQHIRAMGFLPTVGSDGCIVPTIKRIFKKGGVVPLFNVSEANEDNDFIESVPYALLGTFNSEELQQRVKEINRRLREYFTIHNYRSTLKHHGVSLGYTCVSGGRYAEKGKWSGSFHANRNLFHDPELQADVIDVCCQVIVQAFGRQKWYKAAMAYYNLEENKHKKKYLLPGTPCTGIWWSCDGREHNVHVDRNAYCSSFIFCPESYSGGALILRNKKMPAVQCKHLLQLGEVIAGRWSRSEHCIDACNESRNSFVLYGEYRILEKDTYKHVENGNTHLF